MTNNSAEWKGEAYCAVRKSGKLAVFDEGTLGHTREACKERTKQSNNLTPTWANLNPVIRVAKVRFEEVNE